MNVILLLARVTLALVFGIAGVSKLADLDGSRKSLVSFGVPKPLANPLAWLLPLAELICAAALIPDATAWWGATGVLTLLIGFIVGISISLIRGQRPDCHCFGQLHSSPIGWQTLVRNAVLAGMSSWIVLQGRENAGLSIVDWTRSLSGTKSTIAALAIAIAAVAAFELWALIHVLRQNGRLLLRLEAVEAKLGGTEAPPPGLPVGNEAPGFELRDLSGDRVSLATLLKRGNPLLLFFSEPGCSACDAVLPEVSQWQRDYRDRLSIVPITSGDISQNREKSRTYGLSNVLMQTGREVVEAYRVEATPSAVLVKNGRIESPVAVGTAEIRGLVARATLPPPVKAGDPVPSLRLPDLSGEVVDLAQLRSRRTLMLFWSPSCGFCQQMLEDIKKWEDHPQQDAPELVVISAGPFEDNRKQGFRSRVLLDPYYAASQVFDSGGTPSGVVLEDGRVATEVAVGAEAVLALAGATSAHQ